jgi:hypothetical protein
VAAGFRRLRLTISVADPADIISIVELCGGGDEFLIDRYINSPGDPMTSYEIHA